MHQQIVSEKASRIVAAYHPGDVLAIIEAHLNNLRPIKPEEFDRLREYKAAWNPIPEWGDTFQVWEYYVLASENMAHVLEASHRARFC